MAGRIRTVKPEWLEDERLLLAGSDARTLSIALILLSDDYGRGRAHPALLSTRVFPSLDEPRATLERALGALDGWFVRLYSVRGQRYFQILNWKKHQRVDKPGKPQCPAPEDQLPVEPSDPPEAVAYFIRGEITGLIKIGKSIDPIQRLAALAKQGSEPLSLLAVGGDERSLHRELAADRVHGEWFRPTENVLAKIRDNGGNPDSPIATATYEGDRRVLYDASETTENGSSRKFPGESGTVATDRDRDQDQDQDQDREIRSCDVSGQVKRVFEAWKHDTGHHRAKLSPERSSRIRSRLREGFTPEELIRAITHRHHDPWLMGENPSGKVYDGIKTLLRDAEQAERLRDLAEPMRARDGPPNRNERTVNKLMDRALELERREREEQHEPIGTGQGGGAVVGRLPQRSDQRSDQRSLRGISSGSRGASRTGCGAAVGQHQQVSADHRRDPRDSEGRTARGTGDRAATARASPCQSRAATAGSQRERRRCARGFEGDPRWHGRELLRSRGV